MSAHNVTTVETEEQALLAKLAQLMGDDLGALIDLDLPGPPEENEARRRHRERTAQYKTSVALKRAPDSDAVAHACSYLVIGHVAARGKETGVSDRLIRELVAAGYDLDECTAAVDRLVEGVGRRREAWRRRTRQRLGMTIVGAVRELRGASSSHRLLSPGEME
jgi:hypothetical protein